MTNMAKMIKDFGFSNLEIATQADVFETTFRILEKRWAACHRASICVLGGHAMTLIQARGVLESKARMSGHQMDISEETKAKIKEITS